MIEPHTHIHNHALSLVIETERPSIPAEALWAYWHAALTGATQAGAPLPSLAE